MRSGSGEKKGEGEKLCVCLLFLAIVHEDVCCAVGENYLVVTAYGYLSLQV